MNTKIDSMHINHFLIYVLFGIFLPNRYLLIVTISIMWEVLETVIVHNKKLYELTKKYWFIEEKYWNEININKFIDLIVNLFGYFLGSKLRTYICYI